MIDRLKNRLLWNAKNVVGWRTNRKIVVLAVDDYGNVRLHSKEARERLDKAGLPAHNRFDKFDTLETRQDLESLFEVLVLVKDKHGRHAVFTPFAVPCNINFEKIKETNYREYYYELIHQTFGKLSSQQPDAYEGAWDLMQEGIAKELMVPQFHGREHLNLRIFEEKLFSKDKEVLTVLKNRSYTSIKSSRYPTISATAAFEFWDFEDNERFNEIIEDGLDAFKKVYDFRATNFTPPVGSDHPAIHEALHKNGIKYLDAPLLKNEHQGKGDYKRIFNYTGKTNKWGQVFLVRNVVFEPTDDRGVDWVNYTMKQIEAAFRWNRPAIISSHRVNFCGHIDESNRQKGIAALKELLKRITSRWPEVEFMSANELGALVSS